jgi:hypothetical protein
VVYLSVDKDVQLARIAHPQETTPHQTFPMSEADVDAWREQFQVPDTAELDGGDGRSRGHDGYLGHGDYVRALHRLPTSHQAVRRERTNAPLAPAHGSGGIYVLARMADQ